MKVYKVSYEIEIQVGGDYPDTGEYVDSDDKRSIAAAYSQHIHDLFMQDEDIDADALKIEGVFHDGR